MINKNNNIILFADDASFILIDNNREDLLLHANSFLKDINSWLDNNLLNLNLNKTYFMEFKTKKHQ